MTDEPPIYRTSAVAREAMSSSTAVTELLAHRLDTLQALLRHLEEQHDTRTALSQRLQHALDTAHCAVRSDLVNQPDLPAHDPRRTILDNRLALLEAEARRELVTCWQDHATLQREWRQWRHQHDDLKLRLTLLHPPPTHHDTDGA